MRILAALNHEHIVKILACFVESGRDYLVLEHIQGRTLRHVARTSQFTPIRALAVASRLADIVSYLHEQKPPMVHRDLTPDNIHSRTPPIVHRDFTPDNLMISDDSMLTLIDFNVAKQLESEDATQSVVGKHSYIPPEQFRGESCPQSDLYAMGCSLYYLLTGEEPEPISVARPKEKISEVSEGLNELVAKCTQQRLDRRYASAFEVKTDLAALCLSPVAE